ncbi:hypothetical protein [Pseudonocardia sp. GCM10023141]|uniref:hypothetical protein n=1 Tax=Pseudonocardia sp. GCM10023141 TaxID=3252653 RepID=UPI0036092954
MEVVSPLDRRVTRKGIDLRRTDLEADESVPWGTVRIASPLRMALDLALDRPLPDAVADLDAVLRKEKVDRGELAAYVAGRNERGIVAARRAVALVNPLAEVRPESRIRVHLVLAGLDPVPQFFGGAGLSAPRPDSHKVP